MPTPIPGPMAPRPIARATASVLIEPVMMKTSLLRKNPTQIVNLCNRSDSAASSKRHKNQSLVAGYRVFSLDVVFNFCLRFMLGRGRQLQEDQRQQREDQGLHEGH